MKKIFSSTFVIILTIILSFSLYKIIIWIRENKQNDKIINEVSESISTVQDNNKIDNTINYNVNFDKLKLINPDCIAWLKVEGTSIKYPIVKGMVPESGALASAKGSSAEKGKLIADTAVDEFVKIIGKYMK